jgi:hypothetical protein
VSRLEHRLQRSSRGRAGPYVTLQRANADQPQTGEATRRRAVAGIAALSDVVVLH